MIEKIYKYSITDEKLVERIVDDENVTIGHVVLAQDEGVPTHFSDSNVYITIIRGEMAIELNDENPGSFSAGTILNVPYNTKMSIRNLSEEPLEFFAVKAPNPKNFNA